MREPRSPLRETCAGTTVFLKWLKVHCVENEKGKDKSLSLFVMGSGLLTINFVKDLRLIAEMYVTGTGFSSEQNLSPAFHHLDKHLLFEPRQPPAAT